MTLGRRNFVIGSILVAVGGVAVGRHLLRGFEERSAALVRSLCDHFIPGHDDVPGAVALGIDREIHEHVSKSRRGMLALLGLSRALEQLGYSAKPFDEQSRIVVAQLQSAFAHPAPSSAKTVETLYRECARRYLTRPEAWAALRYRTPQPHGYPDYTQCSKS